MKPTLVAALGLGMLTTRLPSQVPVASGPPPERLMIGPAEYLRSPNPFPVNLPASPSSTDLIRARNLAPREWGMAHALPCRPVTPTDTTGWMPVLGPNSMGVVGLPPGLAPDTTFRPYHGGMRWTSPELAFTIENGWWGVPYDSAGYLTACRVKARAGEYLVNEIRAPTGFSFSAFPWSPAWGPSTKITGRATDEEGLRALWTAFMMMAPPQCRYMTGGPIRDPAAPTC